MTLKSYKTMRVKELKDGVRARHKLAGELVERRAKARTPIGTPATTGKPNYPITHALQNSIDHMVTADGEAVEIGTSKEYAKYVHNGTGPGFRGRDEWSTAEGMEYWAIYLSQYPGYKGPHSPSNPSDEAPYRGMMPRGFLVNGLLRSRTELRAIYGKAIVGKPPHG